MSKTKPGAIQEVDMCHGPLTLKIIAFTIPLIISRMLQLLFNAADVIVVGRFAGSESLAAVGSTTSLINLLVNLFVGLSVGANVVQARAFGLQHQKDIRETLHTSMLISVFGGVLLTLIGIPLSRYALEWMGSPEDVIDLSTLYLRIYFLGMPAMMIYNFGSAVLNAAGDTKHPLYYLMAAGVVNVILNLFFVIVCDLGVAGVATATVLSQLLSTFLVLRCLIRSDGSMKLERKYLKISRDKLTQILKIGLPAGVQGMVFSLSNIVLQSAINSFGSATMAGNAAAQSIEGFIYVAMSSFQQAALTFTGQNVGARQWKRVRHTYFLCSVLVAVCGAALSLLALLFGRELLGIYTDKPEVIVQGLIRMQYICTTYALCGLMDVAVGSLRGLGHSAIPMVVSLWGACGLRILWVATVFRADHTLNNLYITYPISWTITLAALVICLLVVWRRQCRD